jgi:hypothetical protein
VYQSTSQCLQDEAQDLPASGRCLAPSDARTCFEGHARAMFVRLARTAFQCRFCPPIHHKQTNMTSLSRAVERLRHRSQLTSRRMGRHGNLSSSSSSSSEGALAVPGTLALCTPTLLRRPRIGWPDWKFLPASYCLVDATSRSCTCFDWTYHSTDVHAPL